MTLKPWIVAAAALPLSTAVARAADYRALCGPEALSNDVYISCLERLLAQYAEASKSKSAAEGAGQSWAPAEAGGPAIASGFGAEQVVAREATRENHANDEQHIVPLRDFAINRLGDYVFFLENGQIWRQKSSDSSRLRLSERKSYIVQIRRGSVSGYRLSIAGKRSSVLVERLK